MLRRMGSIEMWISVIPWWSDADLREPGAGGKKLGGSRRRKTYDFMGLGQMSRAEGCSQEAFLQLVRNWPFQT